MGVPPMILKIRAECFVFRVGQFDLGVGGVLREVLFCLWVSIYRLFAIYL